MQDHPHFLVFVLSATLVLIFLAVFKITIEDHHPAIRREPYVFPWEMTWLAMGGFSVSYLFHWSF